MAPPKIIDYMVVHELYHLRYRRVSTLDQSTARQLDGMTFDKEFEDKVSGKDTNHPALQECIKYAREGDIVVVHSIDRLARNLGDLERIIKEVNAKSASVEFVTEKLTFTPDNDDKYARLHLHIKGAFAQFERALIKERQREGIAVAKANGVHFGRAKTLANAQEEDVKTAAAAGVSKKTIAKDFGISRQTVYEIINGRIPRPPRKNQKNKVDRLPIVENRKGRA
jgi:DNA invertase Pin-like site-specific DNA recombinase